MKKIVLSTMASFALVSLMVSPTLATTATKAQSKVSTINPSKITDIKEGVEVLHYPGYTETITTKIINQPLDQYVQNLKKGGANLLTGSGTAQSIQPNIVWQDDYFSGNGSAKNTATGQTGYIYCYNGHVALETFSGHVDAYLVATGATSNKARMNITTYGAVGGGALVSRDYVFAPSDYVTNGSSNYTVNSDLNGSIAYYQVSVYGDHKKDGTSWTSQASLQAQ